MIREFVDRTQELRVLEEEWKKPGGRLIVLYGRRRIGKTRLISEFARGKPGVLSVSEDTAPHLQMRQLQHTCAGFLGDSLLASLELSQWEQLFSYLAKHAPRERSYLVIDEFTYLARNDPSILSALQKAWDGGLTGSSWCILLCGSMLGLMSDLALSPASPLYGRRTRDMLLPPLGFPDSRQFLGMQRDDALRTYLSIGGVPEYLLKAGDYRTFREFAGNEFFDRYGYFYREPYFMLSQEFRELKMYQSILQAIAAGNTIPSHIARFCGTDTRHLYPYLEGMVRLGIVERELPILVKTRKGIYRIRDRLFDFWYSFIFPHRQEIDLGITPGESAEADFERYFGRQFENFVRQEIAPGLLPGHTVGRWWYAGDEIDIVAFDDRQASIVFGECKWSDLSRSDAVRILRELGEKSGRVRHPPAAKEQFLLVARSIGGKESLRGKGYLVYDLEDIVP